MNVPKPVMPEVAKKKDLDGQKAFIQYWIATYNYMRESGDTAPFLAACEKTSKFCAGSVKNLDDFKREGIWRVGGRIEVSTIVRKTEESPTTNAGFTAVAVESPTKFFTSQGQSTDVALMDEAITWDLTVVLKLRSRGWTVLECGSDQR